MDWTNYLNNKYFEIIEKNAIKTTENKEKTKHDKFKRIRHYRRKWK